MRRSVSLFAIAVALLASFAIFAGSASAYYGLGTNCAASSGVGNVIAFDPATSTATDDGVITRWTYGLSSDVQPRRLVVMQRDIDPTRWDVVSVSETLYNPMGAGGIAQTDARIPILKGQVIGVWATGPYVPTCTVTSDSMLEFPTASPPTVGSSSSPGKTMNVTSALGAIVEPDVDKDGFGDETQDRCNHSGKITDNCPTLVFTGTQKSTKKAFRLLITSSIPAPVTAVGTARLSKRKTISITSKEYVSEPGKLTTLRLDYPRSLRDALKKRTKKQPIKVKIVVTAIGIVNDVKQTYIVKLRGTRS